MNGFTTELMSLAGGVVIGLVFERRETRRARRESKELQSQVDILKTSIFSLYGKPNGKHSPPSKEDLASLLTQRAIATQNPAGHVDRRALTAYFIAKDHTPSEVDSVISSLCQSGIAKEDGIWLQMI